MSTIELLIKNAAILTMNDERDIHPRGFVAINDGKIVGVGSMDDCPFETAAKVIDAQGKVVTPGFVNTHCHFYDILLRGGIADDKLLYDWLFNITYPAMAAFTQKDVEAAASLWCMEAIKSGITTFVENHDNAPDRIDMSLDTAISVYEKFGLRARVARQFIDSYAEGMGDYFDAIMRKGPEKRLPFDIMENTDAAIASMEAAIKRHKGRANGRIEVWPSPSVVNLTTVEGLIKVKELARKYNSKMTCHMSESPHDRMRSGVTDIEFLSTLGILDSDFIAVHCTQVDDNDIRIMARTDTRFAHCVSSNMFMGAGIAPLTDIQTAGIVTSLGTDNATANNTVNMLADMKLVALAQKGKYQSATAITAERILEMATIEGAKTLGLENEIGSLEVGKKADINVIGLSGVHMFPQHNIPSVLVYQTLGNEVETVIVDGKILMENKVLTLISPEEEIEMLQNIQLASESVAERAGLEKNRAWCSYKV